MVFLCVWGRGGGGGGGGGGVTVEGFASMYDRPNSPVSWVDISPNRLGEKLTEAEARDIHPRLFERLERELS